MDPIQETQIPTGVTPEVAAPIDAQPVQPNAQTVEGAQPTTDGQGTPATQETVSYDRFKEVNDSKNDLQQQLLIYQQASLQQVQQQPQPQSRLEQFETKLNGLEDNGEGAININEAKEMVAAMKDEFSNMNSSQQQNQEASFLAQNPDYSKMVGQNVPGLGFQYAPEFIETLNRNPASMQQISNMTNPIQQAQAMLSLANQHKVVTPAAPVTPAPLAPPSLSAMGIPQGSNTTNSIQGMSSEQFNQLLNSTPVT